MGAGGPGDPFRGTTRGDQIRLPASGSSVSSTLCCAVPAPTGRKPTSFRCAQPVGSVGQATAGLPVGPDPMRSTAITSLSSTPCHAVRMPWPRPPPPSSSAQTARRRIHAVIPPARPASDCSVATSSADRMPGSVRHRVAERRRARRAASTVSSWRTGCSGLCSWPHIASSARPTAVISHPDAGYPEAQQQLARGGRVAARGIGAGTAAGRNRCCCCPLKSVAPSGRAADRSR